MPPPSHAARLPVDGPIQPTLGEQAPPVKFADRMTVTYARRANPIRDSVGNHAPELTAEAVTNRTAQSTQNRLVDLSLTEPGRLMDFHSYQSDYRVCAYVGATRTTVTETIRDP